MKRFLVATLMTLFVLAQSSPIRADEKDAKAVLDKAIKAIGGEEKLAKVGAFTYKSRGVITFNDNDNAFESQVTIQGLDHHRNDFGNDQFKGVIILNGDKGWRKFGDNLMPLDDFGVAREKRTTYLQFASTLLLPLKGKGFTIDSAPDQTIDGKPAAAVKAIGPDGKDFTIYFDKESGLPVKQVAGVLGFQGEGITQTAVFSDYKESGGIKKAMKVEFKHDGKPFLKLDISEFTPLEKAAADTFNEPS